MLVAVPVEESEKIMVGSEMPLPVEFAIPILKMEDAFHYLRF